MNAFEIVGTVVFACVKGNIGNREFFDKLAGRFALSSLENSNAHLPTLMTDDGTNRWASIDTYAPATAFVCSPAR